MARRAQELGGRRLTRSEWFEVADRFFADEKKARARATVHPDAEAIYWAYPRHEAKEAAIRAISAAIERRGGDSLGLLEAATAYCKAVKTWPKAVRWRKNDVGATFDTVPLPASWFNAGRFDDDRTNWPTYGATAVKPKETAQDEPPRWKEYLMDDMPDCAPLKEGKTWLQIDPDIRAHIVEKMKKKGYF
jgi:hypothetical protein